MSNHQSWIDIGIVTYLKFPSFTPKAGIKKWPVIGEICDLVFNSLFIDRAGTPEEKEKLVQKIVARQMHSSTGQAQPLIMFPEGCTTNNTSLITFRRGAFFGLWSVQPLTISYDSPYFSCAHDVIN